LIKLPFGKEERIKVLTEHCAKIESLSQLHSANPTIFTGYKDIEKLANDKKVYYLTDKPVFVLSYIDDSDGPHQTQLKTKNVIVESTRYDSSFWNVLQRRYQNDEVFIFYHLNVQMGIIRGTFIKSPEIIAEERDQRIDDILS